MRRPFAVGHRLARLFWMLPLLLLGFGRPAWGFPIFARKYQTSCVTCHTVYPKLNAFGQAFRLNGYRMPKETEEQIKQKPVSLGSDAYKRVWPGAVWPNELPGNAPLAANVKMASVYTSSQDAAGNKTIVHSDFQFPQEVNLFAAGTLGEHMSFMAELTHAENSDGSSGTEIEHARLDFDSILGPDHAFSVRIGKFAPNLYDGFQEMWIMTDNGVDTLFNYNPVGFRGGNGNFANLDDAAGVVSLPARARAIEAYGVLGHRFFYTFGLMSKIAPGANDPVTGTNAYNSTGSPNGNYNNNTHKDFYLRFDYKFGGMGLDGDTEGVQVPPENWREKSFRIGVLGLKGNGTGIDALVDDPTGTLVDPNGSFHMQDTSYTRTGLFASWVFSDLNVFGVFLNGKDTLELRSADNLTLLSSDERTYKAFFVQADYVLAPPFHVSARYEKLTPGDTTVQPLKVMNFNFTYLAVANVKFMLEYQKADQAGVGTNKALNTVIRAAF